MGAATAHCSTQWKRTPESASAASRSDHPHHAPALEWLNESLAAAARGVPFVLMPVVAAGFVRVVSSPMVFPDPTPIAIAFAFIRALLSSPGVTFATMGSEWPALERLCEVHRLSGNDVTDAWIAAAVLDQHEHLATFDRGFRRLLKARDLTILKS